MKFERTPEYLLSLAMRPACDVVLSSVWCVPAAAIHRFEKSDLFILDRQFAIDLSIKLANGSQITGQEKTLSNKFYGFRTFTIEFYQNRVTKEPGEFFKIASQFYLHGYADESGTNFVEWKVLNILHFIDWLKNVPVDKLASLTRPAGGSRAAFLPVHYDKIPKQFIHAEWRRQQLPAVMTEKVLL